jgi:hypothetical protein
MKPVFTLYSRERWKAGGAEGLSTTVTENTFTTTEAHPRARQREGGDDPGPDPGPCTPNRLLSISVRKVPELLVVGIFAYAPLKGTGPGLLGVRRDEWGIRAMVTFPRESTPATVLYGRVEIDPARLRSTPAPAPARVINLKLECTARTVVAAEEEEGASDWVGF